MLPDQLPPEHLACFPDLAECGHKVTSAMDPSYNCIAHAAGDSEYWWWPRRGIDGVYWPEEAPCEETLEAFEAAYATRGFILCDDPALESGFEKIAIYAVGNIPKHAARQLLSGKWTSKLGRQYDIEHGKLEEVNCPTYGVPVRFMKRPFRQADPRPA